MLRSMGQLSCVFFPLFFIQTAVAEVSENRSERAIFLNDADSSTNYIKLSAPDSLSSDYNLVLPDVGGTSGQILQSDGSGALLWGNPPLNNPLQDLGDTIYDDGTATPARLPGNTTTTKKFLTQTGTGSVSAAPAWGTIATGDLPAASSTGAGIQVAEKQYVVGTSYTNGTPALTGTNWTTTRATLVPYQTVDGAWRLRLNIFGSVSTPATSITLSLSGVLFYSGRQAMTVNRGGGTMGVMYAYGDSFSTPTDDIFVNSDNNFSMLSISGDVELTGKPSWAD